MTNTTVTTLGATVTITKRRLRKIAVLEKRIKGRLARMAKGARIYAKSYAAARKDLVALAKLQPWEAKGLPSWQEYAQELFGASERQLYREFAAAKVAAMLEDKSDNGCQGMTNGQFSTLPESLFRPITSNDFTDEERVAIWGKATTVAAERGKPQPTAAVVEEAAREHRWERAFNLLTPTQQRQVIEQEEARQQNESRRAMAKQKAAKVEKAVEYLQEAMRAYERGLSMVRRGGKKVAASITDGTRQIMNHVTAAIEGTERVLAALREDAAGE